MATGIPRLTAVEVSMQSHNWLVGMLNGWYKIPRHRSVTYPDACAALSETQRRRAMGAMTCKICNGGGWLKDYGIEAEDRICFECDGLGDTFSSELVTK